MNVAVEAILKVSILLLTGGLIGAEREYQGKAAGLRTTTMICVGTTLFTLISERFGGTGDRIAANIVDGIGFVISLASLLLLVNVAARIQRRNQTRDGRIVTTVRNKILEQYEKLFTAYDLSPTRSQQRTGTDNIGRWRVDGVESNHEKYIKRLLNGPEVKEFTC